MRALTCPLAVLVVAVGGGVLVADQTRARAVFDLVALDATGRPVLDLTPEDVQVTVGGQTRPVRSMRFAFRGAGSDESARGGLTTSPSVSVPARVVMVVVDENAIRPGRAKTVASSAWRVVDSLTPTDLVAAMALPRPRGQTQLGVDRSPLRAALNGIVGRAAEDTRAFGPTPTPPTGQLLEPGAEATGPEQVEQARAQQRAEADERRTATDQAGASGRQQGGTAAPATSGAPSSPLGESFRTLGLALQQFTDLPGQKAVIYVTGGDGAREDGLRGSSGDPGPLIDAAALARVNVHVVLSAEHARAKVLPPLERLAEETGGTVTTLLAKKPDLGDLTTALASGYLVELEPSDTDRAGRVATLSVKTVRKGVTLVTASRWALRDDPLPEPEAPLPTSPPAPVASPAEPKPVRAGDATAPDIELHAVMARVSRYVDTYLAQFGSVVAEEDYRQTVRRGSSIVDARRTKADLLLVRSANGWQPFRDVFEVDGRPVRDRQERLTQLFLANPGQALAEATRISEESSRYNLGLVQRTINTPIVALSFFRSAFLATFEFKRHGTSTIDGAPLWRIDYREIGRPTQIVHGTTGADMPSTGAVYVEPTSGRVVRTVLQNRDVRTMVEVIVTYRPNDSLGLWTPMQMSEHYWMAGSRGDDIWSEATYSGFRRFQVETSESLKPPK